MKRWKKPPFVPLRGNPAGSILAVALCLGTFFEIAPAAAIPATESTADAVGQLTIPHPNLDSLDPGVRRKVETLQQTLETARQRAATAPAEVAEGFGTLGQVYHAAQLLDAAEICYSNSQILVPTDYRWPYFRALARNSNGKFDQAIADYEKTLELGPEPTDVAAVHIRLGNALLDTDRPEQAREHFERARELSGESAAALAGLGRAAVATGDAKEAVEYLGKALTLAPGASALHFPLSRAYRALGDEERARLHLEQRGDQQVRIRDRLSVQITMISKTFAFEAARDLARDPESFSETDFMGFVLAQFGDMPGVSNSLVMLLGELEKSGEAGPLERGRLHYALGGLLVAEGRDQQAIDHFRRAVELDSGLKDARIKLGNALARRGGFAEAVTQYDAVLAADADNATALGQRAAARTNLGDLAQARSDLERLIGLQPDHREAHLRLAGVLQRMEQAEAAVAHLVKAIALSPTPPEKAEAHVLFAELLRRQGESRSAAEQYQAAQIVDPRNEAAFIGMAGLMAEVGRYRDAALVYHQLSRLRPESVEARMGEVTALILAGEHTVARERLEEGLIAFPGNVNLRDVLARHLAACPDRSVRDGARALELAHELYGEVPTPESMETLAMAHAEAGQFAKAVEWQRKLIEALGEQTGGETRRRREENLARYERRETCCAQ
ncbi:MAG: tetratricopeptide repeat protein [bacterium]|nr:tetratricopeptide repeat protein [bacterium]